MTSGEAVLAEVLGALTSNRAVWEKSALFYTYDENGGFFGHVPPPRTPGEELKHDSTLAGGFKGPVGLGFRVPMLVICPTRAEDWCARRRSITQLVVAVLETRFGPEVLNLSAWRRSVTGDLTSAFNFGTPANPSVPSLPTPS